MVKRGSRPTQWWEGVQSKCADPVPLTEQQVKLATVRIDRKHLELSWPPTPIIQEPLPGIEKGAEALKVLGEAGGRGGGEGVEFPMLCGEKENWK